MNLFYLDRDPVVAASYHYDKHKVKMVLEAAQMLCTAHHALGEQYEYDRLKEVLLEHQDSPAQELVDQLANEVESSTGVLNAP